MKYAYAYPYPTGPVNGWGRQPPQTRAADTVALGSLGGSSLAGATLYGETILPAPGAPEPIGVSNQRMAMGGCSCRGSCGCGTSLADVGTPDIVGGIVFGVAAYLAWKVYKSLGRK